MKLEIERELGGRLMEALGTVDFVRLEPQEERLPWINQAISVYQVLRHLQIGCMFPECDMELLLSVFTETQSQRTDQSGKASWLQYRGLLVTRYHAYH